mgnify:CR=1 FL=1
MRRHYGYRDTKAGRLVHATRIPRTVLDDWLDAETLTCTDLHRIGQRIHHESPADPETFAHEALAARRRRRSNNPVSQRAPNDDASASATSNIAQPADANGEQAGDDNAEADPDGRNQVKGTTARLTAAPTVTGSPATAPPVAHPQAAADASAGGDRAEGLRDLFALLQDLGVGPTDLQAIWPYALAAADGVPPADLARHLAADPATQPAFRAAIEDQGMAPAEAFHTVVVEGREPTDVPGQPANDGTVPARLTDQAPAELHATVAELAPQLSRDQIKAVKDGLGLAWPRGRTAPRTTGTPAERAEIDRVSRRIETALNAGHLRVTVDGIARLSGLQPASVSEVRNRTHRTGKTRETLAMIDRALDQLVIARDPTQPQAAAL